VIASRDHSDRNILRDDRWSLRHRKRVRNTALARWPMSLPRADRDHA